ncbi:efflux RND transporter periplasmic adaptor subunit [Paenibacillus sp. TRM 82003]|nr:efflux RND transporter periplasmic adaptor subunit [Paenibacillus sp. TRM 82003]
MGKKWLWIAGLVLVVGGLAAVNVVNVGKTLTVTSAEAERGVLSESVYANGRLAAASERSVFTDIGGKVETVHVKEGDEVAANAPLLTFRTDDWERQLAAERNQLEIASVQRTADRRRSFESVRAASDAAEAEKLQTAETNAQRLHELQMEATERNIAELERQIRENVLLAPAAGVVTGVAAQEGATVPAGFEAFRTVDVSQLVVEAALNELDAGKVRIGMEAVVTGDAFEASFPGRLTYIAPVARPAGADGFDYEVPIRVTLEKDAVEAGVAKPGFAATVEFALAGEEQVLAPLDAVTYGGQDAYVYRIVDGQAVRVPVTVGKDDGERIEILSGLEAGESYVYPVPDGLREGDRVKEGADE